MDKHRNVVVISWSSQTHSSVKYHERRTIAMFFFCLVGLFFMMLRDKSRQNSHKWPLHGNLCVSLCWWIYTLQVIDFLHFLGSFLDSVVFCRRRFSFTVTPWSPFCWSSCSICSETRTCQMSQLWSIFIIKVVLFGGVNGFVQSRSCATDTNTVIPLDERPFFLSMTCTFLC